MKLLDVSLRDDVLKRHPELNSPLRVHNRLADYVPLVDRWVMKQLELQEQGMSQDEAFAVMERQYQDYRYRRLVERLVARR